MDAEQSKKNGLHGVFFYLYYREFCNNFETNFQFAMSRWLVLTGMFQL